MSIPMNADCILCLLKKNLESAIATGNDAAATAFARDLVRLYAEAPEDYTSPHMVPQIEALMQKPVEEMKELYNTREIEK